LAINLEKLSLRRLLGPIFAKDMFGIASCKASFRGCIFFLQDKKLMIASSSVQHEKTIERKI